MNYALGDVAKAQVANTQIGVSASQAAPPPSSGILQAINQTVASQIEEIEWIIKRITEFNDLVFGAQNTGPEVATSAPEPASIIDSIGRRMDYMRHAITTLNNEVNRLSALIR